MLLIVGLGNPGLEYINTRHNIGFSAIELLSDKYNIEISREKFKGMYGEGFINNTKVILLKPTTFMNLSGESVFEIANFYKLEPEEILVIYDDISLPVGKLRIRTKGSAGGHNGIKSIIANLKSEAFPRIKIGVGQPKGDLVNHVLGKFSKEDSKILEDVLEVVSNAAETIISKDITEAMNKYNSYDARNNN